MLFVCHPQILHISIVFSFSCLQLKMAPRKTKNNTYAIFWDDKERALWYVMVFAGAGKLLRTNGLLCPGEDDFLRGLILGGQF